MYSLCFADNKLKLELRTDSEAERKFLPNAELVSNGGPRKQKQRDGQEAAVYGPQ
jgi:hypothetical protein